MTDPCMPKRGKGFSAACYFSLYSEERNIIKAERDLRELAVSLRCLNLDAVADEVDDVIHNSLSVEKDNLNQRADEMGVELDFYDDPRKRIKETSK